MLLSARNTSIKRGSCLPSENHLCLHFRLFHPRRKLHFPAISTFRTAHSKKCLNVKKVDEKKENLFFFRSGWLGTIGFRDRLLLGLSFSRSRCLRFSNSGQHMFEGLAVDLPYGHEECCDNGPDDKSQHSEKDDTTQGSEEDEKFRHLGGSGQEVGRRSPECTAMESCFSERWT